MRLLKQSALALTAFLAVLFAVFGGNGDLNLSGDSSDDEIYGGTGQDTIFGQGGNDIIYGEAGADTLYGNGDNDTLIGGTGSDLLFGGSGNDTLFGGDSSDQLYGGSGFDTMDGGENSDVFFVDSGDTVTDTGSFGYDKVQINNAAGETVVLTGWSGVERVNGFTGNDTIDASSLTVGIVLSGGDGADTLTGGSGADILLGGPGKDTLSGGGGNDTILGGADGDLISGGAGNDIFFIGDSMDVVTDGGAGFDRAVINNAAGLSVAVGSWTLVERINGYIGNDTIDATGLATGIMMSGFGGNDILTGGNGDDRLDGGTGSDVLLGGLGADTFVFIDDFGQDVVKDFADGIDKINFVGHSSVRSISDLTITQNGLDTVIAMSAGGSDQITLANVAATNLEARDFVFQ